MITLTKNKKIIIGAIVVIIIIAVIGLKFNFPKRLLNYINEDLIEERDQIKNDLERLEADRLKDSIWYADRIGEKNREIQSLKINFNATLLKLRNNEKALNDYSVGNFPSNFNKFSNNVTGKDSLSIDRLNLDIAN